jgi:hypothetical protein
MSENVTELFKPETEGPAAEPAQEYHSVLKAWRSMLDPEMQNRHLPPSPDWCATIIARWPFLKFSDCGTVQREYFAIFDHMHEIIEQVYRDHPKSFEVDNRDDDAENKDLYVFLLAEWQRALFIVQSEWKYDDPDAGPKMAALGEVHAQVLGKQGMAAYLGAINLPYTQEEQNDMNEELEEFRKSLEV